MLAGVPVWYTAVVPLPLALPDILQRLRSNYYRHAHALQHDAGTIASNAELYNGEGSDVARTAAGEAFFPGLRRTDSILEISRTNYHPRKKRVTLVAPVASLAQHLPFVQSWRGALLRQ